MAWSPKRAGFESGSSGNSSYGKPRKKVNYALDFWSYRASVIAAMIEDNINFQEQPNGDIKAFIQGAWRIKTVEMQKLDHEDYLKKIFE